MKKILFLFLSVLALSTISLAQGVEKRTGTSANASQIYLEAGGPAIVYSVNYDGRFQKLENGFGFRVGLGGLGGNGDGYFALPVQVNYLFGEKGQYLELGAGTTLATGSIGLFDDTRETYFLGTATIGFRKQPFGTKGLTWRVAFTPFFGAVGEGESGFGLLPYLGASLGYRF